MQFQDCRLLKIYTSIQVEIELETSVNRLKKLMSKNIRKGLVRVGLGIVFPITVCSIDSFEMVPVP